MRKFFLKITTAAAVLSAAPALLGSGFFAQKRWLENGGKASEMSPEFYWAEQLQRMAVPFKPLERRVKIPRDPLSYIDQFGVEEGLRERDQALRNLTTQTDIREFERAIATGRIVTQDSKRAKSLHFEARAFINNATPEDLEIVPPDEVDSEFADYHRGALFFAQQRFMDARSAWEELLKRPAKDRYYRSVWAAFMLGKTALKLDEYAKAALFFQETRKLAHQNQFADALGLAAESYGWEARAEWKGGNTERAAELYLTQLALGDESAMVSLKALIPARTSEVESSESEGNAAEKKRQLAELAFAAKSPLLRKLVTAHVLATETRFEIWTYDSGSEPTDGQETSARSLRWLALVEKEASAPLDDAEHLGWVAYTAGRFQEAERWLKLADMKSPTSLWLQAKLLRREGKIKEAAKIMAVVFKAVMREKVVTRYVEDTAPADDEYAYTTRQSAAGDLAGLHLARSEFSTALDVFLKGDLWGDAAYVADRVLSVEELQKYVDAQPSKPEKLRWLLGRRLVREGKIREATPYFPPKHLATLQNYGRFIATAEDAKNPASVRADAYFQAAWIARYSGMELMGAEFEPDGFTSRGVYAPGEIDLQRSKEVESGLEEGEFKQIRLFIPATEEEKVRLQKSAPTPNKRFHYRYVAGELAWKAGLLLPNDSEELADVLNCAGYWIRNDETKTPDRFYSAIESRCRHTKLGKRVLARRWFVEPSGCWSDPLKKSVPRL